MSAKHWSTIARNGWVLPALLALLAPAHIPGQAPGTAGQIPASDGSGNFVATQLVSSDAARQNLYVPGLFSARTLLGQKSVAAFLSSPGANDGVANALADCTVGLICSLLGDPTYAGLDLPNEWDVQISNIHYAYPAMTFIQDRRRGANVNFIANSGLVGASHVFNTQQSLFNYPATNVGGQLLSTDASVNQLVASPCTYVYGAPCRGQALFLNATYATRGIFHNTSSEMFSTGIGDRGLYYGKMRYFGGAHTGDDEGGVGQSIQMYAAQDGAIPVLRVTGTANPVYAPGTTTAAGGPSMRLNGDSAEIGIGRYAVLAQDSTSNDASVYNPKPYNAAVVRVPSTVYNTGQTLTLQDGSVAVVKTGGTSSAAATLALPTAPSTFVTDGSVVWEYWGVYDAGDGLWSQNAPYAVGATYQDPNGYLQRVTTAGVSGTAEPAAWSSTGTTTDGTVTWTSAGVAATPISIDSKTNPSRQPLRFGVVHTRTQLPPSAVSTAWGQALDAFHISSNNDVPQPASVCTGPPPGPQDACPTTTTIRFQLNDQTKALQKGIACLYSPRRYEVVSLDTVGTPDAAGVQTVTFSARQDPDSLREIPIDNVNSGDYPWLFQGGGICGTVGTVQAFNRGPGNDRQAPPFAGATDAHTLVFSANQIQGQGEIGIDHGFGLPVEDHVTLTRTGNLVTLTTSDGSSSNALANPKIVVQDASDPAFNYAGPWHYDTTQNAYGYTVTGSSAATATARLVVARGNNRLQLNRAAEIIRLVEDGGTVPTTIGAYAGLGFHTLLPAVDQTYEFPSDYSHFMKLQDNQMFTTQPGAYSGIGSYGNGLGMDSNYADFLAINGTDPAYYQGFGGFKLAPTVLQVSGKHSVLVDAGYFNNSALLPRGIALHLACVAGSGLLDCNNPQSYLSLVESPIRNGTFGEVLDQFHRRVFWVFSTGVSMELNADTGFTVQGPSSLESLTVGGTYHTTGLTIYNTPNTASTAAISPAGIFRETLFTPTSSTAPCTQGTFADDANYHYVCVATDTWKRVALASF